jgi:alkylation response protein AidB-like acyl-CoA dehydrogenase
MIDLLPNPEQAALVDAVASFVRRELPLDSRRPAPGKFRPDAGADLRTRHWTQFGQMGWLALSIPESSGGTGYGPVEEALLFAEFGRHLLTPGLFAAAIAAQLAHRCGDAATARAIASGQQRVAPALPAGPADGRVRSVQLIDADRADLIVLLGPALELFTADDVTDQTDVLALDGLASLDRARLAGHAPLLASSDRRLLDHATLLVSAMQAGVARAALELAVAYAKVREQFGQPIGAFQTIKHKCADMAVNTEAAATHTALAALSLAEGMGDAGFQVAAAAMVANRAAKANGEECIQIHGGMGFTMECDAHLFIKRAYLNERLLAHAVRLTERVLTASNELD